MFVHIYTQKLMTVSIYSINIWWCIGIRIINRMFSLPISNFSMINRLPLVSLEFQKTKPKLSSVQLLSHVQLFATPWITARRAYLSITNSRSPPKHKSIVGEAIQPSHPLSSPSPLALNPSQHQGLFQWVSSSHTVAKILESQLQHQSFQWTPRTDLV